MTYATYQTTPEVHGNGMFFFTDCCGNRMYAVDNDAMVYHGKLCPGCMWKGKQVTLYLRGTDEANEVMKKRMHKAILSKLWKDDQGECKL